MLVGAQRKKQLSNEIPREGQEASELRSDLKDESKTRFAEKQLKKKKQQVETQRRRNQQKQDPILVIKSRWAGTHRDLEIKKGNGILCQRQDAIGKF